MTIERKKKVVMEKPVVHHRPKSRKTNFERRTVSLQTKTVEQLKTLADAHNITFSYMVDKALTAYVRAYLKGKN